MSSYVRMVAAAPSDYGRMSGITACLDVEGVTFEFPLPFVEIGSNLIIFPATEVVENGRVVLDTQRWQAARLDPYKALPALWNGQNTAIRAARDFESDPGIDWDSDAIEIGAWISRHLQDKKEGQQ